MKLLSGAAFSRAAEFILDSNRFSGGACRSARCSSHSLPATIATMPGLPRVARFPNLRALAWSGDTLYASRGYELLRAKIQNPVDEMSWQRVATFRPPLRRRVSALNRLTARLFRDGFHALALTVTGGAVAAVPGAIITLPPDETEFRQSHRIIRGTRPLHITAVPGGAIYWGEYFDNLARDEVHIYGSADHGATWSVAYTFPKGAIRHVHNIVHDSAENCLWILTGDYGDECRILRASIDLSRVESVLQGNQQARAVAMVPAADGLYFSSDTPLESNYIYHLNRQAVLSKLAPIDSSSIYGCRVEDRIFFSTMVEPSAVNTDRYVHIYGGGAKEDWRLLLSWKKDRWPLRYFQYGNAFLPDGSNTTKYLAVTTVAVKQDDQVTSIYSVA